MSKTDSRLCLNLTDTGKVLLRGTFFVALAAMIVPAFGILSALISIMAMALIVGFILRPRIQINGNVPDRIIVGQTTRFSCILKNTARLSAYNLCLEFNTLPEAIKQIETGQIVSRLGPGESVEVNVAIRSSRRGHYKIEQPVCRSGFPFNLFNFGTTRKDEETIVVLPNFYRLQFSPAGLGYNTSAGGARLIGQRRAFPEYAGNRPFIPGDSLRRIDSRAWARLSVPATKEYHEDFDKRTALILDTCISDLAFSSSSRESPEVEAAISLCASVAFTINNDCLIDVFCAGNEIYQFPGISRMMCLDKIHDVLAGIKPSKSYALEKISPILISQFSRISDVFFILLSLNKTYRRLIELANQAGCHCNVLLIGQPDKIHIDEDDRSFNGNLRILSPEEILTGKIKRL